MWPFEGKLKDQDALDKYRRWLRRWLLGSAVLLLASAGLMALAAGFAWNKFNRTVDNQLPVELTEQFDNQTVDMQVPSPAVITGTIIPGVPDRYVYDRDAIRGDLNSGIDSVTATVEAPPPPPEELLLPVNGAIAQKFGIYYSQLFNDYRYNSNLVFDAEPGGPVSSAGDGLVTSVASRHSAGGNRWSVVVSHGGDWQTVYHGLAVVRVQEGQQVSAGEVLGALGAGHDGGRLQFVLLKNGVPSDPEPHLK